MKYPLVENPFDAEDLEALNRIIRSGQFTMGPKVSAFEQSFAKKHGSKYAVMVNSGSSANLIGLNALFYKSQSPLKTGDEVLAPALGWATTWAPLRQLGLKVKIVDIDLETLNVDVKAYENAVTDQTKAIITVSILGNPLDFSPLKNLCREKGLLLFEDNCESMGATSQNRPCGTFGDVGTFSFFYSHHMSTMEGGMILTTDPEIHEICLKLRAHGWTRGLPENEKEELGREIYTFSLPGYNVRPLEFSGALGLSQLEKLDQKIKGRRENARLFQDMMSSFRSIQIQKEKYGESSWYAFTMILNEGSIKDRNALIRHLRDYEIESRMITGGCFTRHPMARYFEYTESTPLNNALKAHDQGLFVANFSTPMKSKLDLLYKALKAFGAN